MKKWLAIGLLAAAFAFAAQDAKEDLIKLDKEWGAANLKADKNALGSFYAEDMIGVSPEGVATKAMLLDVTPSNETTYVSGEYEVKMLGNETAVMVHRGGSGENSYRSLHVWAKRGGKWQVVATATIPMASK